MVQQLGRDGANIPSKADGLLTTTPYASSIVTIGSTPGSDHGHLGNAEKSRLSWSGALLCTHCHPALSPQVTSQGLTGSLSCLWRLPGNWHWSWVTVTGAQTPARERERRPDPAGEYLCPSWRVSASQHLVMLREYVQASSSPFIIVPESPCFDVVALMAFFLLRGLQQSGKQCDG